MVERQRECEAHDSPVLVVLFAASNKGGTALTLKLVQLKMNLT
jgi:hypothetical protein